MMALECFLKARKSLNHGNNKSVSLKKIHFFSLPLLRCNHGTKIGSNSLHCTRNLLSGRRKDIQCGVSLLPERCLQSAHLQVKKIFFSYPEKRRRKRRERKKRY